MVGWGLGVIGLRGARGSWQGRCTSARCMSCLVGLTLAPQLTLLELWFGVRVWPEGSGGMRAALVCEWGRLGQRGWLRLGS